jgi:hypothetical protein
MRTNVAALILAVGLLAMAPGARLNPARAQAETQAAGSIYDQLQQSALTEPQIKQYIAAQGDMEAAMQEASPDAGDTPDANVTAKLDEVAKKYNFASYDDFNTVAGNIALIVDGIDPNTKQYVGAEAILKQAIADVKADAKISDADRKEALEQLKGEMNVIMPVKFPANIDLVIKYYDALAGGETQSQ